MLVEMIARGRHGVDAGLHADCAHFILASKRDAALGLFLLDGRGAPADRRPIVKTGGCQEGVFHPWYFLHAIIYHSPSSIMSRMRQTQTRVKRVGLVASPSCDQSCVLVRCVRYGRVARDLSTKECAAFAATKHHQQKGIRRAQ